MHTGHQPILRLVLWKLEDVPEKHKFMSYEAMFDIEIYGCVFKEFSATPPWRRLP